jgi:hypothetical protein
MSIDYLSPQAITWSRPTPPPISITDHPRWWRHLADREAAIGNDDLAASYRDLADLSERYLPRIGGRP